MKKIELIVTVAVLTPIAVVAQSENTTYLSGKAKSKRTFIENSRLMTLKQMDQRKIYHWANGQRSTPTGREAAEPTSGYVRVFGDSAEAVDAPVRKK